MGSHSKRTAKDRSNKLLLIKEAAEILGVCEMTLRRWDHAGKFKARRNPMNNFRVYSRAAVLRLLKRIRAATGT